MALGIIWKAHSHGFSIAKAQVSMLNWVSTFRWLAFA